MTLIPRSLPRVALFALAASSSLVACGISDSSDATAAQEQALSVAKSVLTQHNDNARSGVYLRETALSPSTVTPSTFGRLYARHVDGQIAAQPLYAHALATTAGTKNVVIVATRKNAIYAFDTDDLDPNPDKAPIFQTTLVGDDGYGAQEVPGMDRRTPGDTRPICLQTHGPIGITATPVIDPATSKMYVVARMAPPVSGSGGTIQTTYTARYTIYEVDFAAGRARPLTDIAPPPGLDASNAFDPNKQLNRPALLLTGGRLYVAFGGLVCDDGAGEASKATHSHGWVFAYDPRDFATHAYSHAAPVAPAAYLNTSYNPPGAASQIWMAGIWQSGQGLAADANGVYFTTGNNEGPGTATQDFSRARGDAILRLRYAPGQSSNGARNFDVAGWRAQRWQGMDDGDTDLGSGGVALLPNGRLVAGGKEGRLYVVDRATMQAVLLGAPSAGATDGLLAYHNTWHPEIPADQYYAAQQYGPNIHGSPVVWTDSSNHTHLYAMPEKEFLTRYTLGADGAIDPLLRKQSPIHRSPDGMPGGALSLSANGGTGGIVWASVPTRDEINDLGPGRLIAFDAQTLAELWHDDDDVAYAKFTAPTVANGKVFRATFGGELVVYGLARGRAKPPCNDAREAYRVYGGAEALGGPEPQPTAGRTDLGLVRYGFDAQHALTATTEKNAIFHSPTTCGHVVRNDILAAYEGKRELLGLPITNDESTSADRLRVEWGAHPENGPMRLRYTHFERGSIFSSPRTGAHEIHGPIRDKWAALDWDRGLGFPSTDVVTSPDGRFQHSEFEKFAFLWDVAAQSAIYWSPSTNAHSIYGGIYSYWKLHPSLGLPLEDERDGAAADGRSARVQSFENGTVYWMVGASPFEVFGVWRTGTPSEWFDATNDEVRRTNWDFADVESVTWAQAARAATGFCGQRGFVGGHFTGEQARIGEPRRGVVCFSRGAAFYDSHDAELAAQTWKLPSAQLDAVAWAAAGRVSDEYCRSRGFLGGFFTGHQVNDLRGIVCAGPPADAFDAQQADVDATGWGFADVNGASWSQASRAAHHVCADPGFHHAAMGGHFAGHQVGGARKLICVR